MPAHDNITPWHNGRARSSHGCSPSCPRTATPYSWRSTARVGPARAAWLGISPTPWARRRSWASTTSGDPTFPVGTSHDFGARCSIHCSRPRPGRYQRWDWDTDTGAEWHDVPLRATVVVEGVGSTRTELGSPWDLTVWVDAPQEVRLRRGVERDGVAMRHVWVDIWIPQEDRYVASERPHERADVIVSGLDGLDGVV